MKGGINLKLKFFLYSSFWSVLWIVLQQSEIFCRCHFCCYLRAMNHAMLVGESEKFLRPVFHNLCLSTHVTVFLIVKTAYKCVFIMLSLNWQSKTLKHCIYNYRMLLIVVKLWMSVVFFNPIFLGYSIKRDLQRARFLSTFAWWAWWLDSSF